MTLEALGIGTVLLCKSVPDPTAERCNAQEGMHVVSRSATDACSRKFGKQVIRDHVSLTPHSHLRAFLGR